MLRAAFLAISILTFIAFGAAAQIGFPFPGPGRASVAALAGACSGVANLRNQYISDVGVTGSPNVTAWNDQIASAHMTGTSNPQLVAAELNGKPAIKTNGSTNYLTTTSLGSFNQPFTWIAVVKLPTSTNPGRVILGASLADIVPELVERGSTVLAMESFGGAGVAVNPGTANYNIFKMVFNGTSSALAMNGGADQTNANNISGNYAQEIILGGGSGAGQTIASNWVEFCIFTGAMSGGDWTTIKGQSTTRYGIP